MNYQCIDTNAISAARIEYWSKGFVLLKGIFTQRLVESWRREAARLWNAPGLDDDLNLRSEFRRNKDGEYVFDRLDPVIDLSCKLKDAVMDEKLKAYLDGILGAPSNLLKCKLIRKYPGTGGYLHHQDFRYWRWLQMNPDSLCSVVIPLYDCDEVSGGIEFFPFCHDKLLPAADGNFEEDFDIRYIDLNSGVTPRVAPGDVLIFHSLVPHRSGPNFSERPRTLLLPSYATSSDAELYKKYYKREVLRRCKEFVGFERYEAKMGPL